MSGVDRQVTPRAVLRVGRPVVSLILATVTLTTYVAVVLGHYWITLPPEVGTRDGVVSPAAVLKVHGLHLLIRFVLSALGFFAILSLTQARLGAWFLRASVAICILSAWAFLSVFRQEFMAGYVFRRPQDNTGYLYLPAIYSPTIIVSLVAYLIFCLLVLPFTRTERTGI